MVQSVNNKEENTIIVYDLIGTEALRYMSEKEKQNCTKKHNNKELVVDVTGCETADEVMSRLKNDKQNFQPDKEDYNKLFVQTKDHFWLKVDNKLYIKFGSYIQRHDGTLSSNQETDENNTKTKLPAVKFYNKDCAMLKIFDYDEQEEEYCDSDCNVKLHKNEEAKKHGQIEYHDTQQYEIFCTKDTMQTLYRNKNTYLCNIGDTYKNNPSQLPLALCGINQSQNNKDPWCLCGVGCCSPYGMIDEKETKDLEQDIFPLFNLEKANKQNEEKIIKS